MDLRQIIRESINSVILDSIISEAIINEGNYKSGRKKNRNFDRVQKNKNLQQKKQDNARQQVQNAQNSQTVDPQQQQVTQQAQNTQTTPQNQQNSTVDFSQYADELRKIVGNSGIDPKPVQNNKAAVQHIDELNHFAFAVINAIDSNNIDGVNAQAAGGNSRWVNPYEKDRVDMGRDAMKASVNYLGNNAENLLGNGAGLQNNPFNGVFRAGVDAYNDTNNLFTQQINNRKYEELYSNPSRNGNAGGNLTYLMQSVNNGCYPRLQTEYHQINQQNNNIFSTTPDVGNCYQVLQALSVAVTSHANSQKQQNTQQPNGGQQGRGNDGQPNDNTDNGQSSNSTQPEISNTIDTEQSKEKQMFEGFANRLKQIDGNGERLQQEEEYAQMHNLEDVSYFIKSVGELSEKCITAIEYGKIRTSDETGQENIIPLTIIMGLSDYFTKNENVISFYDSLYRYHYEREIDKKLPKDTVAYNLFMTLYNLRKQMEAKGIMDDY